MPHEADQDNVSLPSIELARGTGASHFVREHLIQGASRNRPIEISSFQSSSSWISPLYCEPIAKHQGPEPKVHLETASKRTASSPLISDPSPLSSSPCLRQQHRLQLPVPRNQQVPTGIQRSKRVDSNYSATRGVSHEPDNPGKSVNNHKTASALDSPEGITGNILASVERDDDEHGATTPVQPGRQEITSDELVLPSTETDPEYSHKRSGGRHGVRGEGRCSFNDKHLQLLSSDDRSQLRRRLNHRTEESRRSHSDSLTSSRGKASVALAFRTVTRRSTSTLPTGNSRLATLPATPQLVSTSVYFDGADIDPGAPSYDAGSVHPRTVDNRPIYDAAVTHKDFIELLDRIASLSVCRGILPQEIAPILEAQTRFKLLPPLDQHSYMLNRSSRLGFRPNTAFRIGGTSGGCTDPVAHVPNSPYLTNARHLLTRSGPHAAVDFELRFELEVLQGIVQASGRCLGLALHDPGEFDIGSWASEVHSPLLSLATRYATTAADARPSTSVISDNEIQSAEMGINDINRTSVFVSQLAMAQLQSLRESGVHDAVQSSNAYALVMDPLSRTVFERNLRNVIAAAHRRNGKEEETTRARRMPSPGRDQPLEDSATHTDKLLDHHISERYLPIGAIILRLDHQSCHSQCNITSPDLPSSTNTSKCHGCPSTRSRLASWARLWYARIHHLANRRDKPLRRTFPLPILAVDRAEWLLFFVREDNAKNGQPVMDDMAVEDSLVSTVETPHSCSLLTAYCFRESPTLSG